MKDLFGQESEVMPNEKEKGRNERRQVKSPAAPDTPARLQIFSSGGGVQSACISAMICNGEIEKPRLCAIADTGREKQSTWDYWNGTIKIKMEAAGVECVRLKRSEWAYQHDDLWNKKGTHLMPLFTTMTATGLPGKTSNFCSTYWKVDVVDNYIRKRFGITRGGYVKWIGFSVNEARRVLRMMDGKEYKDGLIRFPLIHDRPTSRDAALAYVIHSGWPQPPRSRCFMCPLQTEDEWREIKDSPKEWKAAIALEKKLQERDPTVFLHKSCVPLGTVNFGVSMDLGGDKSCDSGGCFL